MFSEYSELHPINGWILLASLGHSSKFQRFSCFGFVTAATSLNRSRPKFALRSAISWPGVYCIYIFGGIYIFGSSFPLAEFCHVQNSLCVQLRIIAQVCRAVSSQLRHMSTIGKNWLNSNTSFTCFDNMANFGLLTAEICWQVWGTHANFNGFRILAALLHGTLVVGVSQTLRRWTEGATYIRQGGHQVGHWPTF